MERYPGKDGDRGEGRGGGWMIAAQTKIVISALAGETHTTSWWTLTAVRRQSVACWTGARCLVRGVHLPALFCLLWGNTRLALNYQLGLQREGGGGVLSQDSRAHSSTLCGHRAMRTLGGFLNGWAPCLLWCLNLFGFEYNVLKANVCFNFPELYHLQSGKITAID